MIEKTDTLQSQYTTSINENHNHKPTAFDDSNIHLQLLFHHLEQLLQIDLKSKNSLVYILKFLFQFLRSIIFIK